MGQMRFRLGDRDRISQRDLGRIYIAGPEEIPWSTRATWEGDELVVDRSVSESGCVNVPWHVEEFGELMLTTATLMERQRPYVLEVELARGLLQRLRTRLFVWEWLGLETPAELSEQLTAATRLFSTAATSQSNVQEAAKVACEAIAATLAVSRALVHAYAKQTLASRQRQTPISTLMGVALGSEMPPVAMRRQLVDATNIMQLPLSLRTIEGREGRRDFNATDEQLAWCQSAGLKVAAGPLLRMDELGAPDWMYLWEGDHENVSRLMLDHVRAVVSRYAGRVHLWHVASRVNSGTLLGLEEEQRLQLVAEAIHAVRRLDPRTPTVVSFDQPWAEYLATEDRDLAPLHYADALIRAELGLAGFGLEINAGYDPGGSRHRPAFEYGRLLDQWGQIGLPLMVLLSTASEAKPADDPLARPHIHVDTPQSHGGNDPQCSWAESLLPLIVARTTVQVVLWNQLTDSSPHHYPHGGLFNRKGEPKPILNLMRDLRKSMLM